MKKTDARIVVEDVFDVSIEKVWKALTVLDEMKRWYFNNINAFKPEVGAKSRFAVQNEGRTFTHLWEVTEVDGPNIITYNWKYEEYAGDSFVTFELFEKNDGTQLVLTMDVTENFPEDIPEFARESCMGGWHYFIGERLKEYLGKSK